MRDMLFRRCPGRIVSGHKSQFDVAIPMPVQVGAYLVQNLLDSHIRHQPDVYLAHRRSRHNRLGAGPSVAGQKAVDIQARRKNRFSDKIQAIKPFTEFRNTVHLLEGAGPPDIDQIGEHALIILSGRPYILIKTINHNSIVGPAHRIKCPDEPPHRAIDHRPDHGMRISRQCFDRQFKVGNAFETQTYLRMAFNGLQWEMVVHRIGRLQLICVLLNKLRQVPTAQFLLTVYEKNEVDGHITRNSLNGMDGVNKSHQRSLGVYSTSGNDTAIHNPGLKGRRIPGLQRIYRLDVIHAIDQKGAIAVAGHQMAVHDGMTAFQRDQPRVCTQVSQHLCGHFGTLLYPQILR